MNEKENEKGNDNMQLSAQSQEHKQVVILIWKILVVHERELQKQVMNMQNNLFDLVFTNETNWNRKKKNKRKQLKWKFVEEKVLAGILL